MKIFTLSSDLNRMDEIKSIIKAENLKYSFAYENRKSYEDKKKDFFKFEFANGPEIKRKKILKTLKSRGFKEHFFKLQNMERDRSVFEHLVLFFERIIKKYTTKWKKKNRFEVLIDRLSAYDELSIIEKRVRMAKYGINPMVERDDDRDPAEIKNELAEMTNYRKELGDFLKDDPEYQELKAKQDISVTEIDLYENKHNIMSTLPVENSTIRYDSFQSTLPPLIGDDSNKESV